VSTPQVFFLHPAYHQKEIVYFPLGIGYIAGACREAGITVTCLDLNLNRIPDDKLIDAIQCSGSKIVGISGFLMQLSESMRLATCIKSHLPDVIVVLGGVMICGCEEHILCNSKTDFIFSGEAEEIFPEIVKSIAAGNGYKAFPGVIYREDNIIKMQPSVLVQELDKLPMPAYDLFAIEHYADHNYHSLPDKRLVDMICSRGCPFCCEYCINSKRESHVRYRSTEKIVAEVRFLRDRYNVTDFHFCDENFTTSKKRGLEICAAIKPEHISWVTSCRADSLDEELIVAMRDAGCRLLIIGFESASDIILRAMNKKTTTAVYGRTIALLRQLRMPFLANFMIGMPTETPETIAETVQFCAENKLIYGPSYVTPFPGTKLYDVMRSRIKDEYSYIDGLATLNYSKAPYINLTNMSTEELIKQRDNAVISVVAQMLKARLPFLPMCCVRTVCRVYLKVFDIKNPIIAAITQYITGRVRSLLAAKI